MSSLQSTLVIVKSPSKCTASDELTVLSFSTSDLEIQTENDWRFIEELNAIFATISIRELHARRMALGIIIPRSVEKCTMPSNVLVEMHAIHEYHLNGIQDTNALEAEPEFMSNLRSLNIYFDDVQYEKEYEPPSCEETAPIWTILSRHPFLEELSFNGSFTPNHCNDLRLCGKTFKAKILRLENVGITFQNISLVWQRFRSLEVLYFDLSLASSLYEPGFGPPHIELPPTLKELHVYGNVFHSSRGLWMVLFGACKKVPDIKIITQDFVFDNKNKAKVLAPCLGPSYGHLMEKVGCRAFKSLFLHIRFPWQWTYIQTHLKEFAHLDHLYLYVWLHDENKVVDIAIAAQKITSNIKLLTVDDNHFYHDTSFKILSSFENVAEYAINCDVDSQFFAACRTWNQFSGSIKPWRFCLTSNDHVRFPFGRLRDFAYVKKLSLSQSVNLKVLSNAVPSLEELSLHGRYCPSDIISCLEFSNLRSAHFRNSQDEQLYTVLNDIASSRELHRKWPLLLEKITFNKARTSMNEEVELIRDAFGIKLLDVQQRIPFRDQRIGVE